MSKIQFENGQVVEFDGDPTPQDIEEVAKSIGMGDVKNTTPDVKPYQGVQPQNILGQVFNVPGAAIRSAIQGRGYVQGALQPDQVPRFQDMAIRAAQKTSSPVLNAMIGMPASALGLAADVVTNPADMLGGIIGKAPGMNIVGEKIAGTKAAQEFGKFINKERYLVKPPDVKLNQIIDKSIQKAIRPTVVGKNNSTQATKYTEQARDAVKSIVANKDNLQFIDESGNAVNKLPESLNEFSQSITQTKKSIFKQYDNLSKNIGGAIEGVDLSPTIKTLDEIANNKVLKIKNPAIGEYANSLKERLSSSKLTPSQTQDLIESFNSDLKHFYKNPDYNSASKATIDAAVANNLRKSLDESISKLTGKNYQALKNQYGSLSAIEKDVNRRFFVDARKNTKGLLDFTDIFSAGDIVKGVASLDPATISKGVVQTAIKSIYKRMNDPNNIVKDMFKNADKLIK